MKTVAVALAITLGVASSIPAQQDETVYKPGNDVSTPRLVKSTAPSYTAGAMRRRVSGSLLLRCVVDRDGLPTRLEVVQPLDKDLDQVSLKALQQWRFEPGKKNGKAVLVQIDVEVGFSLRQSRPWWAFWRKRG